MQEFEREKSPIKQRIMQYLEIKGISRCLFYRETGISRGILNQATGISEDNLTKFLNFARDISPVWLMTGTGSIFNTKRTETLATPINKENRRARKEQKTSPNNDTVAYPPTKPISSVANDNIGFYVTPLEIKSDYNMSDMTDEQIDNVIHTRFREYLLEMVESGLYYPATMVAAMMENQKTQLDQAQKTILELEAKLKSCTPDKDNDRKKY